VRVLLKKIFRRFFQHESRVKAGFANLASFDEKVESYRRRGAKIGNNVRLLGFVDGVNPHLISIGDYSVVGFHSALLAHCPIRGALPCRVGKYVYIGFGAIILPGITVGDNCLIGAGVVVTKDVPAGSIAAGNPAKVLRELTQDKRERIEHTMLEGRLFGWDEFGGRT
jgi:acetyltransferase-like isoleucine patch superfamily enzyme